MQKFMLLSLYGIALLLMLDVTLGFPTFLAMLNAVFVPISYYFFPALRYSVKLLFKIACFTFFLAISHHINAAIQIFVLLVTMLFLRGIESFFRGLKILARLLVRCISPLIAPILLFCKNTYKSFSTLFFYLELKLINMLGWKLEKETKRYLKCVKALFKAIKNHQIHKVKLLLAAGVDINEVFWIQSPQANEVSLKRHCPLSWVLKEGRIDIVRFLLENGAQFPDDDFDFHLIIFRIELIHALDPVLAKKLFDKIPEEIFNDKYYRNENLTSTPFYRYRSNKFKKTVLFEEVLSLFRMMRQTRRGWGDASILDYLLMHLKPKWCSLGEYKKLCQETIREVSARFDTVQKKRKEKQTEGIEEAQPVIFRSSDTLLGIKDLKAANKVTVQVSSPDLKQNNTNTALKRI